jgi:hypothetical protein
MSQPINREGSVSIFLLVALVIGAVAGAVVERSLMASYRDGGCWRFSRPWSQ